MKYKSFKIKNSNKNILETNDVLIIVLNYNRKQNYYHLS